MNRLPVDYERQSLRLSVNHRAAFGQLLILLAGLLFCSEGMSGAYIFAGEANGVNLITHPTPYTGSGGNLTVRVCINPSSPNAASMEIPVQNNINIYNQLQATTGNLFLGGSNDIPANHFDFESVALHEIGHCVGMAHVNAATESGLAGNDRNYTKATDGIDNVFDIDPGADGVIGSQDDPRDDDVNLHWYRISNNNPFTIDNPVDSTTYSRDLVDLPQGHNFATNADRTVAGLLGVPNTESVMQQGTFSDEAQRTLIHDDVATLLYAASGLDQTSGTSDDYSMTLEYGGVSNNNCDITVDFDNTETGFAVCKTGGTFIGSGHVRITSANIYFNTGFNWYFNQQSNASIDTDGDGLSDDFETNTLGTDLNSVDTDGDGLADGADGVVPVAALPGGVDSDGDGFVDGELDLGTDPTLADTDGDRLSDGLEVANNSDPLDANSWPNLADGDLAPLDNPDGIIDAADFLIGQRIALQDITPTALELAHGDLYPAGSPDGVIDTSDLVLLLQLVQTSQ